MKETFTEQTDEKTSVTLSKYQANYKHFTKYIKTRYDTDDEFRKKKIAQNVSYNKTRYAEDPEFRQRIKDNVQKYRLRQKELKQKKQEQNEVELKELIQKSK